MVFFKEPVLRKIMFSDSNMCLWPVNELHRSEKSQAPISESVC